MLQSTNFCIGYVLVVAEKCSSRLIYSLKKRKKKKRIHIYILIWK